LRAEENNKGGGERDRRSGAGNCGQSSQSSKYRFNIALATFP